MPFHPKKLFQRTESQQRLAWPVPDVARPNEPSSADDNNQISATNIRPLTTELYLQTMDLQTLPLRHHFSNNRKSNRRKNTSCCPTTFFGCNSSTCHSCSCFGVVLLIWAGLLICSICFALGMIMEAKFLHRFRRKHSLEEDIVGDGLVACPHNHFTVNVTSVTQFEGQYDVRPMAAQTAVECQSMCESDANCLYAYFHPLQRNCHIWTGDKCTVAHISSRSNLHKMFRRDCAGAVQIDGEKKKKKVNVSSASINTQAQQECTFIEKFCTSCAGGTQMSLRKLWYYKTCLAIYDYRRVKHEICHG